MLRPVSIALMVLLAVVTALPAGAGEEATLEDLLATVESRIERVQEVDRLARFGEAVDSGFEDLDLLFGTVRSIAARRLKDALGSETAAQVLDLSAGWQVELDGAEPIGSGLDPASAREAERLAGEWAGLRRALLELRVVAAARGPERACPVVGDEYWFVDDWADARPGGRSHKGTDLIAPMRTPVQAIEDGVVVQASWHRSGGRQIYIRADSTGDVYYYAHLDYWEKWIWTGTRVRAGDVIGLLGRSGNADSPHLHFGWMPGSRRVDLENLQNPYPLLLEICPDNFVPEWIPASDGG